MIKPNHAHTKSQTRRKPPRCAGRSKRDRDFDGSRLNLLAKTTAENVVSKVKGVKGIAEEIEARPAGAHATADDEIARRAVEAIEWTASIPKNTVQVKVDHGRVTLTGRLE